MKLEKQVCSLEYAKKLKELGVNQDSLYFYTKVGKSVKSWDEWMEIGENVILSELYSAFTVAELGEMLPEKVKTKCFGEKSFIIFREKYAESWDIAYSTDTSDDDKLWKQAETEADARAKMLISLLENKLI